MKCYTALDDISAYQRLKTKVVQQLERSQSVLAESFDTALSVLDRVDRPVKNLSLSSMLRFYLERAARHGTMKQTAHTSAGELLDSLDEGYQLQFTRSGLIFDLARTGTDGETDSGVEFHRIGNDLIDELIQAIPTVRPGVAASPGRSGVDDGEVDQAAEPEFPGSRSSAWPSPRRNSRWRAGSSFSEPSGTVPCTSSRS